MREGHSANCLHFALCLTLDLGGYEKGPLELRPAGENNEMGDTFKVLKPVSDGGRLRQFTTPSLLLVTHQVGHDVIFPNTKFTAHHVWILCDL